MVNKESIPDFLKEKEKWIVWKQVTKNGEPTKIPFNPHTGKGASTTEPKHWTDFKTAYKYYNASDCDGLGFVFSNEDNIVGVDLDHCRDKKKGILEEPFDQIVKDFDSYTEVSPSGTGLHIIVKGEIPGDATRNGNYEIYENKRYFTFTGEKLEGLPSEVKERQKEIDDFYEEYIQTEEKDENVEATPEEFVDFSINDSSSSSLTNEEIIRKAKNSSNSSKFESLWNGSTAGYKSQSEADLALCSLLAFWTGGDASRIDRLFRNSGLYRSKWDEKRGNKTYGQMTIEKALHGTTDFYDAERHEDDIPSLEEIQELSTVKDTTITKADPFHEWEFENKLPEDHFISRYMDFANGRTDAYPEYHFGVALNLLSIAVERRMFISIQPTGFYPNLWINLLGMSTIARKSTALKLGDLVLEHAGLQKNKLPDDYSPESLIDAFATNGQRVLWNEEFNTFYSQLGKQYMQGSDSLFSKLYDNPNEYNRKLRNEEVEADDLYFNIMAACVPSQLIENVSETEVKGGFFPRMLLIWCERPKETMPLGVINNDGLEVELGRDLGKIHDFLRDNQFSKGSRDELQAVPTQEALDYYNDWVSDLESAIMKGSGSTGNDLASFAGRMEGYVVKIAALIEIGGKDFLDEIEDINEALSEKGEVLDDEDIGTLKISKKSFEYAVFYASKLFMPNQREFVKQVSASSSESNIQRVYNHAKKLMDNESAVVNHSKLLQNSNLLSNDFKDIISTLREMNRLEMVYECSECGSYIFKSEIQSSSCSECGVELEEVERSNPKKYRVLNPNQELDIPTTQIVDESLDLPEPVLSEESDLNE